jgi:hypothetical protein
MLLPQTLHPDFLPRVLIRLAGAAVCSAPVAFGVVLAPAVFALLFALVFFGVAIFAALVKDFLRFAGLSSSSSVSS